MLLNRWQKRSANLSDAAQSLAEGATDQAATVEEMQATINDLNEAYTEDSRTAGKFI